MEEQTVVTPAPEAAEVPQEETQAAGMDAAETPAPEAAETPQTDEVAQPKKKTFQERIDEITKARREAEREREYWKRLALDKEKPKTTTVDQPAAESPAVPPRPRIEQFDSSEAYEDALFEWRDKKREIETRAEKEKTEYQKAVRSFNERAKNFRQEYADFDEMIEQPVFSPAMRSALLKSENGPAVAYHLGRPENRELAEKILDMPTELQLYEIGKLETKLLLARETKKVPSAPPPIKPVGMGGGTIEKDPSQMTTAEWMAWDRAKEQEKIRKKYGG